jgi:hypothetical protein
MRLLFALVFLALTACATGYGKSNIFGGYWSKPGSGELIEVGFDGNGYIKIEKVEIYLLYRSAEIAKEKQKPFFSIYHRLSDAIVDRPLSEETQASTIGGKPYGKVYMLLHDTRVTGSLETDVILKKYSEFIRNEKAQESTGAKK